MASQEATSREERRRMKIELKAARKARDKKKMLHAMNHTPTPTRFQRFKRHGNEQLPAVVGNDAGESSPTNELRVEAQHDSTTLPPQTPVRLERRSDGPVVPAISQPLVGGQSWDERHAVCEHVTNQHETDTDSTHEDEVLENGLVQGDGDDSDEELLDPIDREILNLHEYRDRTESRRIPSATNLRESDEFIYFQDEDDREHTPEETVRPNANAHSTRPKLKDGTRKAILQELVHRRASKRKAEQEAADSSNASEKSKKKSRRKKPSRRLPVNELITMDENFNDPESDLEVHEGRQHELPEDPIALSQSPKDHPRDTRKRRRRITKIEITIRKGPRDGTKDNIDITQFRMPKIKRAPPILSEHEQRKAFTCSDGFEGEERNPTPRFLNFRQHSRRERPAHTVTLRLKELKIIPDREFGTGLKPQSFVRKAKPSQQTQNEEKDTPHEFGVALGIEPNVFNEIPIGNVMKESEEVMITVRTTVPTAVNREPAIFTTIQHMQDRQGSKNIGTLTDFLKPPSHLQTPINEAVNDQEPYTLPSVTPPLEEKSTEKRLSSEELVRSSSKPLLNTDVILEAAKVQHQEHQSPRKRTPRSRKEREEIEALQQMSMVSIKRRKPTKGGFDSSGDETQSESSEFEENIEDEEGYEADTPEGADDARQERDEVLPKNQLERNSGERISLETSTWIVRRPDAVTEVNDEIEDTPAQKTILPAQMDIHRITPTRKPSRIRNHSLVFTSEKISTDMMLERRDDTPLYSHDNEGYGPYRSILPETVHEGDEEKDEEEASVTPYTQLSFVPKPDTYFGMASQNLELAMEKKARLRSKSHVSFAAAPVLMAGGITASSAFNHTISPMRSAMRSPSRLEGNSPANTLKEITRRASIGMQTMTGSPRKRMTSLPFKPPFLLSGVSPNRVKK